MQPFYLLVGQSNMAGRGNLADLPTEEKAEGVMLFRHGQWVPAAHPLQDANDPVFAVNADRAGGVGPGLSFARAMREGAETIGLLLCAKGGTGIGAWAREGELYRAMLDRLGRAGRDRHLAGALVHVGEGDTRSIETAEAWRSSFEELIANIRADVGNAALPVVFAQIASISDERRSRREHGYAGWGRLKEVQAATTLPMVAMVQTDDLLLQPDGLHLSTAAQLELGRRFAAAMTALIAQR